MDKQVVLEKLSAGAEEMRRLFQVKRLAVFGSVARGQASENSDIDVLVSFEQRASFDLFMELKFYLEDLLGIGVDLVTEKALRPEVRQAIEKGMIECFLWP
ncbi:MAG: nucleotidyltransferase family protein [Planctomycetota bacterium]|nr:nucleotidyltransferase family protein [Planctomycetota bacterium]